MSSNFSKEDNTNKLMKHPFLAELLIRNLSQKELTAIYTALKPETTVDINDRARANIKIEDDNHLRLIFTAEDFISLRAILGSYLRWIDATINTVAIATETK
ncbi:MAG: KEOPS complex subunit Pcc1 [Candidatus Thorarchaeota archaeon]